MRRFGGMLSFEARDPSRIVERLKRLEVIVPAESLGGVESLIEHPASMTHASVPKEQREKQGITDGLVRFSIGLKDVHDLTEDLERALGSGPERPSLRCLDPLVHGRRVTRHP